MEYAVALILAYKYWILFPLACIEGPILGFIAGTLVALGYFNPWIVFGVLVAGDVVPDVIYYCIGRFGERRSLIRRYAQKIGVSPEHFESIHSLWHNHTGTSMVFSKLAYGLSTPFLISAGIVGLNFTRFIRYSLPISVAQYAVLMGLGYFWGATAFSWVSTTFEGAGILVAATALVAIAYYFFTRHMRSRFQALGQTEEMQE